MSLAANVSSLEAKISELENRLTSVDSNNNAFFLVTVSMLIFLMQAGFAFLEAGSVRSKNTTNILIKNLLDSCISACFYWAIGWAFAYGEESNKFIGHSQFFLIDAPGSAYPSWFFQYVFAATAATIVSGALAERCEFLAYFIYCAVLTGFVYPVVTHWAWSSTGWLSVGISHNGTKYAYKDFAGSGVVHLLGGVSALAGAAILGPRIGRFDKSDKPQVELKGHSVPFAALGGFILMFGFFAFNGGSQANITASGDGETVAKAMVNTIISGAVAALVTLFIYRFIGTKKWSLLLTLNAALTGMVAICAGCDALKTWAAAIVGVGAGLVFILVSALVEKAKIDDPLDAVAVHGGGGLWGVIITPIIMDDGIVFKRDEGSAMVLAVNLIGAVAIIAWSGILMTVLFMIMKMLNIFRVSAEIEEKGLDIIKHGEPAYPLSAYGHGWYEDSPAVVTNLQLYDNPGNIRHRNNQVMPTATASDIENGPVPGQLENMD